MEYFEIIKNKKGQNIRVAWDLYDIEDGERSDINGSYINGKITGIGEDGSVWEAWITQYEHDAEDWEFIDTPEQEKPANEIKTLKIGDNNVIYPLYWDGTGNRERFVYKSISVKDWFNKILGDYPNLDYKMGPHYLEKIKLLKEPSRVLISKMPTLDSGAKIQLEQDENEDSEFIKFKNKEGKDLIRATDLGIVKWVLKKSSNNSSGLNSNFIDLRNYVHKWFF